MTSANLENFLKALEAVKQDYTCGVCSELCREPVTLSKCFHIICAKHFKTLKACPDCNISLDGCTIFTDDRLGSCIDSAKEIEKMFEPYKRKTDTPRKSNANKKPLSTGNRSIEQATGSKTILSEKANQIKPNVSTNTNLSASCKLNKAAEKRNNKGETMLHIACRLGKVDKITELLNHSANTNTKDNAGWTPLHEVVQNGRLDLVKLLLQYNTLINVPGPSNETPLHEAVRYNHDNIAEELVRNGADMNVRNCKGETPLQLASATMKARLLAAADDIIQTQSVNITHISALYSELDFDDIHIYCISQFRTVHNKLKMLAKHHSNLHIEAKYSKKITHLIVDAEDDGVCTSSCDILHGIVSCQWIITTQWVTKSTEESLEPFENYEVMGIGTKECSGPKNARYNKYKQLPGIFNGCHFYFHNFTTKYEISKSLVITKAILSKLVTDAGGVVLRRVPNPESIPEMEKLVPYHAKKGGKLVNCSHYIIFKDMYEPMYNMQHIKALPIGWLIECIEKYELCEPW